MDKLLKSILAFLLLFTSPAINGQIIPLEWEGKWNGTVDIWSYNKKTDSFPMSLEITPKDAVWNFIISYKRDVDKPDIRKYELIIIDNEPPQKSRHQDKLKSRIIINHLNNLSCQKLGRVTQRQNS